MNNLDEVIQAISVGLILAGFLLNTNRLLKAIELCKECLFILKDRERVGIKDKKLIESLYIRIYLMMWKACSCIGDNTNAIKYAEKLLQIYRESGERLGEYKLSLKLGKTYFYQSKYKETKQLLEKALMISKKIGDRYGESCCYTNLGTVYQLVGEYEKAREHHVKSLAITREIGDRNGEATCYGNLGNVYQSAGEYDKAREHYAKSVAITREIGDRNGEATWYGNLGNVYYSVGEYDKAREHYVKSLAIKREIGDRNGEASCYTNLGSVYQSVGEYDKAREHYVKSLAITREIGDRNVEASCYTNLGNVYQSVGEYDKAREHYVKSLAIRREIGDRNGEASCYGNLGNVNQSVGEYDKAREHYVKSLAIRREIGDRNGEASCYGNLGNVYQSVGEYEKAREHLEKSLAIKKEIGDREGEVCSYRSLGRLYVSVGEYENGLRYNEKSLAISRRIGNRNEIAQSYMAIGKNLLVLGKYSKANESNKKAFALCAEIGDRPGIACFYANQGDVESAVGNFIKAKGYYEKALAIAKEIGSKAGEAGTNLSLGMWFFEWRNYDRAEEHIKEALGLSEKIGDIANQSCSLEMRARIRIEEGKIQEAIRYFLSAIEKCEKMRSSLRDNDQFKISFVDRKIHSYKDLSMLLCETGNPTEALYVSELSRARALADLMSTRYSQYSVENQISADPRTWVGLSSIVAKECNRTCLYFSYHSCSIHTRVYAWILKASGVTHLPKLIKGPELTEESFYSRSFGILPEDICEDRSLHGFQPRSKSCEKDSHESLRIGNESKASQGPKMNLPIWYRRIIAPIVGFLEGPEIIVVPDGALYQIPFAALADESGKYLSETFRIRFVPSLTTLRLITESPTDYHCQTGALIVGNPDVGEVHFKGKLTNISRLQCAEKEANIIAKKLGVEPLLGQQATKEAVLQTMDSVALIHIAAHGDVERGEIALAPSFRIPNGIPQEEIYLLRMTDISKVQLRAKLVVLSCCHSAQGQTKAEGVIGMARAFLASGARSVLVALWALDDESTEQLMTHFYDHLVAGESAGESLHETMKWMRRGGYDVNQWAPFILIGDDVTFDFGNKGKILNNYWMRFL